MDVVKDKIPGLEDKENELGDTSKYERSQKHERNMQELWDTVKRPNLLIMSIDKEKESQVKGIDQVFNRIIEENIPILRKCLNTYTSARSTQNIKQTGPENKLLTDGTKYTIYTDQRKGHENCKRKKPHKSHTKKTPLKQQLISKWKL